MNYGYFDSSICDLTAYQDVWFDLTLIYDGYGITIFINDQNCGSMSKTGDVQWPSDPAHDPSYLTIGAYKDHDEVYQMQMDLMNVAFYDYVAGTFGVCMVKVRRAPAMVCLTCSRPSGTASLQPAPTPAPFVCVSCEQYSEANCAAAATSLGLSIGGGGYDFAGPWSTCGALLSIAPFVCFVYPTDPKA